MIKRPKNSCCLCRRLKTLECSWGEVKGNDGTYLMCFPCMCELEKRNKANGSYKGDGILRKWFMDLRSKEKKNGEKKKRARTLQDDE